MLPMLRERKTATFGLVAGRHPLPVDKYIWTEEVQNPMDHKALYEHASNVIGNEWDEITVYVTGLTPCLLAVVDHCHWAGITLKVMQYDRNNDSYVESTLFVYDECPFCKGRIARNAWSYYCPKCGST